MAETRDWRGNGRALGWLFAIVVVAVVIWALAELFGDSEGAAEPGAAEAVPAGEFRIPAPSAGPPPLRIA